jgi:hypothetical protein
MSDFSEFFAQNKVPTEVHEIVASKSFINKETGEPLKWKIRKVDEHVHKRIKKDSKTKTEKKGVVRYTTDNDLYNSKLLVASIVYPDLNNKGLQENYGVMCAEDLLDRMLSAGEYTMLTAKVLEINDFDLDINEQIEEAKN